MEYSTKKGDNSQVTITIKNSAEEVEAAILAAYQRAQKKVKIPGFRNGKAPLKMVEQRLGDSVYDDAARNLVSDTFKELIETIEPAPIDYPYFSVESFERGKGAVFSGTYDTFPEVKLGKYKKVKAELGFTKIPDNAVDERIEEFRKQRANLKSREDGEAVGESDIITIEIEAFDGEDSVYKNENFQGKIDEQEFLPDLHNNLKGCKVGDSKSFETTPGEDFPEKSLANRKLRVDFKLNNIQYFEYPELNDEFAKELRDDCENIQQLKEKLGQEIEEQCLQIHQRRAQQTLLESVVEDSKFTIPESLVARESNRRLGMIQNRMGLKDMNLAEFAARVGQDAEKLGDELKEASIKGIKEELVIKEVSSQEKISVNDEEVRDDAKKRFGTMLPPQELEKWLDNPDIKKNIENTMINDKTLKWLLDNAAVSNGSEVDYATLKNSEDFYRQ